MRQQPAVGATRVIEFTASAAGRKRACSFPVSQQHERCPFRPFFATDHPESRRPPTEKKGATISKHSALTDKDYVLEGRRHGSDAVAKETSEAASRWTRDVGALASYGHGPGPLAAFQSLRTEHEALRAKRPEAVAAKASTVKGRDVSVSAAWGWIDMVGSVLGALARSDAGVADRLNAAMPSDASKLDAGIGALAKLLAEKQAALPADAGVAERIAEAPGIQSALKADPGAVATAKAAPTVDTAALDLLDGKLYVAMADLNKAARKAIRNGKLGAKAGEYRFHHLNQSGKPLAAAAAAPAPVK